MISGRRFKLPTPVSVIEVNYGNANLATANLPSIQSKRTFNNNTSFSVSKPQKICKISTKEADYFLKVREQIIKAREKIQIIKNNHSYQQNINNNTKQYFSENTHILNNKSQIPSENQTKVATLRKNDEFNKQGIPFNDPIYFQLYVKLGERKHAQKERNQIENIVQLNESLTQNNLQKTQKKNILNISNRYQDKEEDTKTIELNQNNSINQHTLEDTFIDQMHQENDQFVDEFPDFSQLYFDQKEQTSQLLTLNKSYFDYLDKNIQNKIFKLDESKKRFQKSRFIVKNYNETNIQLPEMLRKIKKQSVKKQSEIKNNNQTQQRKLSPEAQAMYDKINNYYNPANCTRRVFRSRTRVDTYNPQQNQTNYTILGRKNQNYTQFSNY